MAATAQQVQDLHARLLELESLKVTHDHIIDEVKSLRSRVKELEQNNPNIVKQNPMNTKDFSMLPTYEGDPCEYEKWSFRIRQWLNVQDGHFQTLIEAVEELDADPSSNDLSDYSFTSGVPDAETKTMSKLLWTVLSQKVSGSSFNMLRNLERSDTVTRGPVAWYRMFKEAKGMTGIRNQGLLTRILTPPTRLQRIEEITSGIELWESYVHEYNRSKGADMGDSELMFGFKNLLPTELSTLVQNMGFESYLKAKAYVIQQVTQRRTATFTDLPSGLSKEGRGPKPKDSMDTMHVADWQRAADQQRDESQVAHQEDEMNALDKGGGKGRFQGYCRHCGIWGHRLNECRKLTAELQTGGKKGDAKGMEKGQWKGKGKGFSDYSGGNMKGHYSFGKGKSGFGKGYNNAWQQWGKGNINGLEWQSWEEPCSLFSFEPQGQSVPSTAATSRSSVPSASFGSHAAATVEPVYIQVQTRRREGVCQSRCAWVGQKEGALLTSNRFELLSTNTDDSEDELSIADASEPWHDLDKCMAPDSRSKRPKMPPVRPGRWRRFGAIPELDEPGSVIQERPEDVTLNYLHAQPMADASLNLMDGEWEEICTVINSGAAVSVAPASVGQAFPVHPSEGSKKGQKFHTASGGAVANMGEKRINVETSEGMPVTLNFQVADVTRPLASVAKICDAGVNGNTVVFNSDGGYILSLDTGHRTHFERVNGVYVLQTWARRSHVGEQGASFQRQG